MHEQKWRNEKHRKGAATMEGRARLVRNYGIETVNAATMARGVHRANSCATTRVAGTACRRGGADTAGPVMIDRLEWRVAIIGYDPIRWVRYLDEYARQSGEPEPSMDDGRRKTHFVQYIDDTSLRRAFYQALLDIEWLPSKIRSAVMSELGLSLQKRKSDNEEARTLTLNVLVDECKARMRENGEQPRGGIHDSAVAEIAARHGMTAEALKQRITRLNKKRSRK